MTNVLKLAKLDDQKTGISIQIVAECDTNMEGQGVAIVVAKLTDDMNRMLDAIGKNDEVKISSNGDMMCKQKQPVDDKDTESDNAKDKAMESQSKQDTQREGGCAK